MRNFAAIFSILLGFSSASAMASSAINLYTNSPLLSISVSYSPAMAPELLDQIVNQGCIPKGVLLQGSDVGIDIRLHGSITKRANAQIAFRFCKDELLP